jgi:uncharacterized protein
MQTYTLAPFFWAPWGSEMLLTNDAGRHQFLSRDDFRLLVDKQLPPSSAAYTALQDNGLIMTGSDEVFLERWAQELRRYKGCHFTATQLFILVLTDACNQQCIYCQASTGHGRNMMTVETAQKAVELAFSSPADSISIEFQGGEPTLNLAALQAAVLRAEECRKTSGKNLAMAIVTNLTNVSAEMVDWLLDHDVGVSTSLDGPPAVHNGNRPMNGTSGSYNALMEGIHLYQAACVRHGKSLTIQAIQTTTRLSLSHSAEIVNEYRKLGAEAVYLRPLTPLGFAAKNWNEIGFSPAAYLAFYRQAVRTLLGLVKEGVKIREVTASNYLRKILLHEAVYHTEFRSPCGGGIGQMAIQYNGDVYTCDEGRMLGYSGDDSFRLGTVDDSYQQLISSPVVHALCTASCLEGLPGCCDCVYQPFCATCPVVTYGLEGDIFSHRAGLYRCEITKGILDFLFSIIHDADEEEQVILRKWAQA